MGNWDKGGQNTLSGGGTLTCNNLTSGQVYGIFLINSNNTDTTTTVQLVIDNQTMPKSITVPGTTMGQGLASIALVKGDDTKSVSISISADQTQSKILAYIGSVGMPIDATGFNNLPLPINGTRNKFNVDSRYYQVVPTSWHQLQISTQATQFISVMFISQQATIFICNPVENAEASIYPCGTVTKDRDYKVVLPQSGGPQTLITQSFTGNGTQRVWMNADSPQNSQTATISLQSLTRLSETEE
ncbi:MAG: hypothetical protein JGK12_00465 [Microcoleus sp. PH2017_01_SCD_O_A]|uniref:hypothetical protein n=1 Tax=unclassified Microcoleus TaxID=2642155 RepID=UPI001D413DAF|nr:MULTISPECIES: hypothetical protein [unclassified Microcoleus]MCC3416864.1 hypothetical protein [Microcoleus sp. PH2017_07_MST_O_A]MCC3512340.1 hypothetical protein [Microcoleus sp. PH2017_17_BER_D_A]TAG66918.1 MAG: hypothetical protein EAZ25_09685 [Oscillatoriales cyanobacterium]MCC3422421.1 hypothetical protein [Microcoleus sp. PH2017_01_SCD_O_A]MCC3497137.1 hypothetical protein [Microcoleus sp. PH2017_15_JOR_U_A]